MVQDLHPFAGLTAILGSASTPSLVGDRDGEASRDGISDVSRVQLTKLSDRRALQGAEMFQGGPAVANRSEEGERRRPRSDRAAQEIDIDCAVGRTDRIPENIYFVMADKQADAAAERIGQIMGDGAKCSVFHALIFTDEGLGIKPWRMVTVPFSSCRA